MAELFTFSRDAASRIARTVRHVERRLPGPPRRDRIDRTHIDGGPVLAKVTGSESGGGKYTGQVVLNDVVGAPATGNLTAAELGTVNTGETVRLLNVREVGQSTHDLASSGFLPLVFLAIPLGIAADGVRVFAIDGYQHKDCTA